MTEESHNCAKVCGSAGYLTWESNNNPRNIELHSPDGTLLQKISIPEQINGYEYEILACKRAIEDGEAECEDMPHAETLTIMKQMDALRQEWGIKYPLRYKTLTQKPLPLRATVFVFKDYPSMAMYLLVSTAGFASFLGTFRVRIPCLNSPLISSWVRLSPT